ncbi:hypothetical protein ID866_7753, partial [Astraeus odoratus]
PSQDNDATADSHHLSPPPLHDLDNMAMSAVEGGLTGPTDASSSFRMVKVREEFKRIGRFRILVMGRANAGKTTILQRICNTTDLPEIFDGNGNKMDDTAVQGSLGRGAHNIENELIFRSNSAFIFHDSCGFETGSIDEFEVMKKFVTDRSTTTKLKKRIHAIWFCIPMSDNERPITAAEERFFNECDSRNGK